MLSTSLEAGTCVVPAAPGNAIDDRRALVAQLGAIGIRADTYIRQMNDGTLEDNAWAAFITKDWVCVSVCG